jgi:hypothetical protein
MPYTFKVSVIDLAGGSLLLGDAVRASISLLPAGPGATPVEVAAASFADPFFGLVFTSPAVPPPGEFDLLVSDTTSSGDLFRSGPLQPLPPSPGTLTLWVAPSQTVDIETIYIYIDALLPLTIPVPSGIQALVGLLTAGSMIPQSIIVTDVNLTLGTPAALELDGNINVAYFGFINQSSGFSLSTNLMIAPSGDASDPSRIVAVTTPSLASSADLVFDALILLPPAAIAIAQLAAGAVASQVESQLNNLIAQKAASVVQSFNLQMTPTATISLVRPIILPGGMAGILTIGDIFGSAIEAIPQAPEIAVTPKWNCGVKENYTITVTDPANNSPIPGAYVHLSGKSSTWSGTTDPAGQVELLDVVVESWLVISTWGKGPPVITEYNSQLLVAASGCLTSTIDISCPVKP